MANLRESKLNIVAELYSSDPDVRFARVASPLMPEEKVREEIALFVEQHAPIGLMQTDLVELVDPRGNVIGGAIIWEAALEKRPPLTQDLRSTQELDAARYVLAQEFEQTQNTQAPRMN